jgi:recombination protein RecT
MTVRNAVAKRDEAAVEEAKKPTLAQIAKDYIDKQAAMLDAVLPAHVDRKRFAQMTINAVRQAPDLAKCFATREGAASFLLTAGQAAAVGLEPNTPTQECWILPRKRNRGRRDERQEAQLSIGYRGILKLSRRSSSVKSVVAEVVREGDLLDYGYAEEGPYLAWKPGEDRGELTHAFAIVWFHGGGRAQTVLDRIQVEARRAHSESFKAKDNASSPWLRWPEAMWRKSAIRDLAPFLDLTAEAETVLAREEQPLRFDPETGAIDVEGDEFVTTDEAVAELPPGEPADRTAEAVQNVAEAGGSDEAIAATAKAGK